MLQLTCDYKSQFLGNDVTECAHLVPEGDRSKNES